METENDFLETKDHILARSPFLKTFLNGAGYTNTADWLEDTNNLYMVVQNEFYDAFGSNFWELGPKSIFIFGETFGVFDSNVSTQDKFVWAGWLTAMGWEIGNPRQIMNFLTDIVETMSNFEVLDKERFVEEGPSSEQIRFIWTALNLGAHWKDVSESKTPEVFENFISNLDLNLEDNDYPDTAAS